MCVTVKRVAQCELFASRVNCDAVDRLHVPRSPKNEYGLYHTVVGVGAFLQPRVSDTEGTRICHQLRYPWGKVPLPIAICHLAAMAILLSALL